MKVARGKVRLLTFPVCSRDGLHLCLANREPDELLIGELNGAYACAWLAHLD